ncbi:unnamed protein product [Lymnaea stagnalis]|uniref:Uncharacterized protein n=1 Tax=Lymnaea stagnalis TaxID=6523 RepID=A0AAV2HGN4_LYMST
MSSHVKEVLHAQLISKAVLRPDEAELFELTQHAGTIMDPQVFKIILDLLKLNVSPLAIVETLKSMCSSHHSLSASSSSASMLASGGEPHALRAHGKVPSGRVSHDNGSQNYSSYSALGDRPLRSGSWDRQNKNTSNYHQSQNSTDSQNGSSYSSFSTSLGVGVDSYQTRSNDRHSQVSSKQRSADNKLQKDGANKKR